MPEGRASTRPRRGIVDAVADVAIVLALAVALAQAYALLHEAGHALAALSVGVSVVGFDAWLVGRPSVRLAGELSGVRGAWISLGGVLLPWLAWVVAFSAVRPSRPLPRLASLIGTFLVAATLLPWLLFPLLGLRPPGDDVTLFLQRSAVRPAWVSGMAALLLVTVLLLGMRALGGPGRLWSGFRAGAGLGAKPRAWLAVGLALVGLLLLSEAASRLGGAPEGIFPPAGFTLAADVSLAGGLRDDHLLGEEAIAPHRLEVWVAVTGVERGPLVVEVLRPDGSRLPVLAVPESATGLDRMTARLPLSELPAGRWSLQATAVTAREGRMVVAWRSLPGR